MSTEVGIGILSALFIAIIGVGLVTVAFPKPKEPAVDTELVTDFLSDDEKLDRVTLNIAERQVRGEDLSRVFVSAEWLVALPARVGEVK